MKKPGTMSNIDHGASGSPKVSGTFTADMRPVEKLLGEILKAMGTKSISPQEVAGALSGIKPVINIDNKQPDINLEMDLAALVDAIKQIKPEVKVDVNPTPVVVSGSGGHPVEAPDVNVEFDVKEIVKAINALKPEIKIDVAPAPVMMQGGSAITHQVVFPTDDIVAAIGKISPKVDFHAPDVKVESPSVQVVVRDGAVWAIALVPSVLLLADLALRAWQIYRP